VAALAFASRCVVIDRLECGERFVLGSGEVDQSMKKCRRGQNLQEKLFSRFGEGVKFLGISTFKNCSVFLGLCRGNGYVTEELGKKM